MLFLVMYTFIIVTMRLCGQRNTSPKMLSRIFALKVVTTECIKEWPSAGDLLIVYVDQNRPVDKLSLMS